MSQQFFIKIFSTQHGISVRRFDFKDTSLNFEDGNIKGTTTKIKDDNGLSIGLVHTVGQGSGGRFVDDSQDIQTGNFTRIFGGLTLRVIKVGWNGNDGLTDGTSQESFGGFFHFSQDHGSDLGRTVFGTTRFDPSIIGIVGFDNFVRDVILNVLDFRIFKSTSNQTFDGIQRVGGVGDGLSTCRHADQSFIISFCKGHDRRGGTSTFRVFNDTRISTLHDGDTRVGRSQIDTNHISRIGAGR
mmetsp:Transcript_114235/g.330000  ORF Transcript_114235/g.330000 Transcript_114235/m.330000 type:complete len:242 (+) Transcript_114235:135-860(+)